MYSKNIWKDISAEKKQAIFDFGKEYIDFLSASKTERLAVKEAVKAAEAKGFKPVESFKSLKRVIRFILSTKIKTFAFTL